MDQVPKLRKRRTGQWAIVAGLASVSLLLSQPTEANEQQSIWVARTVKEIKRDIETSEDKTKYLIKWGDTLSTIAQALEIDLQVLIQINQISNADLIYAGNVLFISQDGTRLIVDNGQVAQAYVVLEDTDASIETVVPRVEYVAELPRDDQEAISDFLESGSDESTDSQVSPNSNSPFHATKEEPTLSAQPSSEIVPTVIATETIIDINQSTNELRQDSGLDLEVSEPQLTNNEQERVDKGEDAPLVTDSGNKPLTEAPKETDSVATDKGKGSDGLAISNENVISDTTLTSEEAPGSDQDKSDLKGEDGVVSRPADSELPQAETGLLKGQDQSHADTPSRPESEKNQDGQKDKEPLPTGPTVSQPTQDPDHNLSEVTSELVSVETIVKESTKRTEKSPEEPQVSSQVLTSVIRDNQRVDTVETKEQLEPETIYIEDFSLSKGTRIVEDEGEISQKIRQENWFYNTQDELVHKEMISEESPTGRPRVIRLGMGVTSIEIVREKQELFNQVKEILDDTLPKGERYLETAGQYGALTVLKRRTLLDGEVISEDEISRETTPAIDEVWRIGTKIYNPEEFFAPIIDQQESSLYTFHDIDGDGNKELILAEPTSHLERITAIYTVKGGQPTKVIDSGDKTIINIFENGLIRKWNIHSNYDLSRDIRIDWNRLEKNTSKNLHHFIPEGAYYSTELLPGEADSQRIDNGAYNQFEKGIRDKTKEKLDFIWYQTDTKAEVAKEISDFLTPREAYLLYEKMAEKYGYIYPHRLLTGDRTEFYREHYNINRSKQLIFHYVNSGLAGGGDIRFVKRDDGNIDVVTYHGNFSFSSRRADMHEIVTRNGELIQRISYPKTWRPTKEQLQNAENKMRQFLTQKHPDLSGHYNYQVFQDQYDYQFLIFRSPKSYWTFGVDLVDDKVYYLEDFRKTDIGSRYLFNLKESDEQADFLKQEYDAYQEYQAYQNKDSDGDGILNKDEKPGEAGVWNVSDRDLAIFAALAYAKPDQMFVFENLDDEGNKPQKLSKDKREKINSLGQIDGLDLGASDEQLFLKWRIVGSSTQLIDSIDNQFIAAFETYFNPNAIGTWNNTIIYADESNRNLVIAYRGTDDGGSENWEDSKILVNFNQHKDKVKEDVPKILNMLEARGIHYENLYITGHSLGGYLAYHAADKIFETEAKAKLRRVVNFNGPGVSLDLGMFNKLFGKENVIHYRVKENELITVNKAITEFQTSHPNKVIELSSVLKSGLDKRDWWYNHNMYSFFYHLDAGTRTSKDKFKSFGQGGW
ncbi:LysM repeat protein [Streptococcus rupicaprae]|uniref:LysM repeat protein n=1 Tax=Streptococcus rupicaprae TaxID=759619 RepID=A0ABV2FIM4_9STRE